MNGFATDQNSNIVSHTIPIATFRCAGCPYLLLGEDAPYFEDIEKLIFGEFWKENVLDVVRRNTL